MKLTDILHDGFNAAEWEAKGYELPRYDRQALIKKTHDAPTWVHFGGGNIFRAFPAAVLNDLLNEGKYDRGVIVVVPRSYETIDKVYAPYDNLALYVALHADGSVDKKVIGSMTEALKADYQFQDWQRLVEIFRNPTLQMVSFTITEKGYAFNDDDLSRGLKPALVMGKVTALMLERYNAGVALPLIYAVCCLRQVDFIKGKRVHLRLIVTDGFEVESACQKANDQKCRHSDQHCFPTLIHSCSFLHHCKISERLSGLT